METYFPAQSMQYSQYVKQGVSAAPAATSSTASTSRTTPEMSRITPEMFLQFAQENPAVAEQLVSVPSNAES